MLKINQFYWQLYKESPEGKKTIEKFEKASKADFSIDESVALFKENNPIWFLNMTEGETRGLFVESSRVFRNWQFDNSKSLRANAEEMISVCCHGDYEVAISLICPLSFTLYKKAPSYFIPYMFLLRYNYIRQILEDYDLDIMEVPGKANLKDRCFYYLDICDALTKFREMNGLTGPELCAFIYDMERKQYDAAYSKTATPFPQIWLTGGAKDGEEVSAERMFWHGNAETKKGDIIIFYETGQTSIKEHRSCITGIWTALEDGITDPLVSYYGWIIIGNEIKIKPIPFKTLIGDPRTNKLPRIGAHFLGISGDAVSTKQFKSLLDLIEEWDSSFNRNLLPKLPESISLEVEFENRGKMAPEKWVEEYRIKRLLTEMNWEGGFEGKINPEGADYVRQVHLQMGRSKIEEEKRQDGRTDFSLFPFGRWNRYKSADVLIEAKAPGEMDGRKLYEAYWQAESYASRQYAGLIILADKDRLLLFPRSKKDNVFKGPDSYKEYLWDVVFSDPDKRAELKQIILSYRVHSK